MSNGPKELFASSRKHPLRRILRPARQTPHAQRFPSTHEPRLMHRPNPRTPPPNEESMKKNPRGLLDKLRTLIRSRRTHATPRDNVNAELNRFHCNSIMTPSPNADTSVILRTEAMLRETDGPHTFAAVTTRTRDQDDHADGPLRHGDS